MAVPYRFLPRAPQLVEYKIVGLCDCIDDVIFEDTMLSTPYLRVSAPKPFGFRRVNPRFLRDFNDLVTVLRHEYDWYVYRVNGDGSLRLMMANYTWRPNNWYATDTTLFERLPIRGDKHAR